MKRTRGLAVLLCVMLLAAVPVSAAGSASPMESDWKFQSPAGLLMQADGTLLVADSGLNQIVALQGASSTLIAGRTLSAGEGGYVDGIPQAALFRQPFAMVEWGGGIVVSDRGNHCLRLISEGRVRTLAGSGKPGFQNGSGTGVQFDLPAGLAVDENGTLYIADTGNGCIRAMDPQGNVTTWMDGLCEPMGLCWYKNALYITDAGRHQIFKAVNGQLSVLAGQSQRDGEQWIGGFADGPVKASEFSCPQGVLACEDGIYVSDTGNSAIRLIRDGWVSTLAYFSGSDGSVWPGKPVGLARTQNTLLAADAFSGCVLRLNEKQQIFADVSVEQEQAPFISYLTTAGVVRGKTAQRFATRETLTRGQASVMLYRLAAQPKTAGSPAFSDVTASLYCADAVSWSIAEKVISGFEDGTFRPDAPVSRQQLALMLFRYANAQTPENRSLSGFPDADRVAPACADAMAWAVSAGILTGDAGGLLMPEAPLTRGQAAAVFTRFCLSAAPQ